MGKSTVAKTKTVTKAPVLKQVGPANRSFKLTKKEFKDTVLVLPSCFEALVCLLEGHPKQEKAGPVIAAALHLLEASEEATSYLSNRLAQEFPTDKTAFYDLPEDISIKFTQADLEAFGKAVGPARTLISLIQDHDGEVPISYAYWLLSCILHLAAQAEGSFRQRLGTAKGGAQ